MVVSRTPHMTDYEAERRGFHLEVPEYFNFAIDVIGKWASDPNKLAMLWIGQNGEERHITFAQFAERSSRAANAFAALGIHKDDRVLVMLPRIPEWWEGVLGLMKIGAIPIPCTTLLTPKDIQFRTEVSEASGFITDSEGAAKFDQVRSECPTIRVAVLVEPNADPKRAAMIHAWSILPQVPLAIPRWCCTHTPAILSVIPLQANTGSICTRMICTGIYPRWDGPRLPGATYLDRG